MDPASLQQQIRNALRDAFEDVVQEIPGAVGKSPGENHPKKKKGNSSQDGSKSGTQGLTASSNQDGDDKMAEKIANQVLTGLLPKLTAAITSVISSVVQAIVNQAANATLEKEGQVVQSEALLQRYETDRLDQYSRRRTVKITGLPEPPMKLTSNSLTTYLICLRTVALKWKSRAYLYVTETARKKSETRSIQNDLYCVSLCHVI